MATGLHPLRSHAVRVQAAVRAAAARRRVGSVVAGRWHLASVLAVGHRAAVYRVVDRALAFRPEDRFQLALHLKRALLSVPVRGESAGTQPAVVLSEFWERWRRTLGSGPA